MNISNYFSKNITLETERLVLRKLSISDAADMYDYSRRPETSRYLLWSPHPSIDTTYDTLRYILREYNAGRYSDFAVVLKSNGKMIGTAGFTAIDEKNSCAEIGYVLNPDYHGHGYATEAAEMLLNFAFCELGVNRVEAKFMQENEKSLKVMRRLGMTFEGIQRSKMYVKGVFRNIVVSSILRSEYFALERKNLYAEQKKPSGFLRFFSK